MISRATSGPFEGFDNPLDEEPGTGFGVPPQGPEETQ